MQALLQPLLPLPMVARVEGASLATSLSPSFVLVRLLDHCSVAHVRPAIGDVVPADLGLSDTAV